MKLCNIKPESIIKILDHKVTPPQQGEFAVTAFKVNTIPFLCSLNKT